MPRWLVLNNTVLLLCCSIYLGTGVSLVFFQFPLEPRLTVDTYALPFVEPVARATAFFTWMTLVMLATGVVMLATEWFSGMRWVPLVVLAGVIASTLLTVLLIIPHNERLAAGITDPAELREVFAAWAGLNRWRVALWVVQWLAMASWFATLAWRARADR